MTWRPDLLRSSYRQRRFAVRNPQVGWGTLRACRLESEVRRFVSIMQNNQTATPDSTAVRVALWRALHVQVDPPPHVLEDEIGLRLAAPDDGWRRRPDMDPQLHAASSAPPSWPVLASSRIWSWNRPAAASASTSSSAPAWTPSPSAGRRSPPACGCSRSTSLALRRGSGSA